MKNLVVLADAIAAEGVAVMDETNITKNQENNQGKKPIGLWVKILVPVVIVLAIAGIFIFKNINRIAAADFSSSEFDLDATENFDLNKLLSYGLPVMIDFGSDSCTPCKEMAPILKELNQELRGKAIIKFVDVWKNPKAAEGLPLSLIPTQFFFDRNGKPYVRKNVGGVFDIYEDQKTNEHKFTSHEGKMDKETILAVLKELGVE